MAIESIDTRDEETPLVVGISESGTPKKRTRDLHVLSCAFLLVFLAYGAAQNLETTVNAVSFIYSFLLLFIHNFLPLFGSFCC